MQEHEQESLIKYICGDCFDQFRHSYPVDERYFHLNELAIVDLVGNASVDIDRVAAFHSESGASVFRKAAYLFQWLSKTKPLSVVGSPPINLMNATYLNFSHLNANFSTSVLSSLLVSSPDVVYDISPKLLLELRYISEFRSGGDPDTLSLAFEHILSVDRVPK